MYFIICLINRAKTVNTRTLKYLISLVRKRNSNYTFNENIYVYGLKLCDNEKRLHYCKQTPLKRSYKMNLVGIERKRILESLVSLETQFFRTSNTCFNRFINLRYSRINLRFSRRLHGRKTKNYGREIVCNNNIYSISIRFR